MLLAAVVMIAAAYSDEERRDYFGDYRVPAGFVYSEATITPDKSRELARKHAVLTLVNVAAVSPAVAEALATPDEDTFLTLPALANLDEETARMLAQRYGCLRLWGLKSVTPEVAAALVAHDGDRLELNGIKEISPATARALAKGRRSWGISVGLIDLPPEIATEYARAIPGSIPGSLLALETLTPEAATVLATVSSWIRLHGLTRLTPELAKALTDRQPPVHFLGIKTLDGPDALAVAETLASTPAPVYLGNLERVSAPALAALRKKATITLPPDERLTIVP
jgi:hypothetical protein